MKKIKRMAALALTLCLFVTLLPTVTYAANTSDLLFNLNDDGVSYYVSSYNSSVSGEITIPSTYKGKPVTGIGDNAFAGCSNLTYVELPNSVTCIGDYAFLNCYSLVAAAIPDSVTTIGEYAFEDCWALESITIPDSVIDIGDGAFCYCYNLTAVKISDRVSEISANLFLHCGSLTSVTIPDGIAEIGTYAFEGCHSLTSLEIPNSVTCIGANAFENCHFLTDVYYGGTEEGWNRIKIETCNGPLDDANIHYNARSVGDVNLSSWQFSFVQYALERKLMAGKGTNADGKIKFDPNSPITREEFVQVLYNAESKPSVEIANKFPDVKDNAWYKDAVLWANSRNIANGLGDGSFGIGKNITRQDLALMLYKYAALKGVDLTAEDGKINQFADGDKVSGYARTAMNWAVTNGILSGKGEAGKPLSTFRLDPTGTATRAECAAMLKNFMTAFGL